MRRRISIVLAVLILVSVCLAGCQQQAPAPAPATQQTEKATEKPTEKPADKPAASSEAAQPKAEVKPLKVGLSNTFMFPWRAQMIDDIERLMDYYKGKGWVSGLTIQNAGVDVNTQISQIRNLVNSGVNILLINPISADALNPVAEEAVAKGVIVVAFDQAITAKGVFNVTIDHYTWGYELADWECKKLGGKGNVAIITGLDGHPASDARVKGQKDAIAKYPGIKLLNTVQGGWEVPGAQKAANTLLASYPQLNGIITQDGMVLGVINAAKTAKRKDLVTTGETQVAVLKVWKELKEKEKFETFGIVNPPGIGATALGIAVRMAQGKKFTGKVETGNIYYYPIKTKVDNSNFDEFYAKFDGRPDSYYPDEWAQEDDLDALFK